MLTVLLHVFGLVVINQLANRVSAKMRLRVDSKAVLAVPMGYVTLLIICLHGLEAVIWAAAYRFLGALPNARYAMLYSLNAITSYGHTDLNLEDRWQLMGALEALDGWLLFGLTTAFLFATIQRILLLDRKH